MPITRQPVILPIWPTTEPVAPAAPEITRVSPALGLPTWVRPRNAVLPVVPSTLSAAGIVTPSGTFARSAAARMAYSLQPSGPATRSPTAKSGLSESTTRPAPEPGMMSPTCVGAR